MKSTDSNIAISVIIPIYNSEFFLRKCLTSVAKQTMSNFEVIMVDDGSTDSSFSIAKEFTEAHENFKLITQSNKGVSSARNNAIRIAQGEYLAFIDSDDFVSPFFLESLYALALNTDADVVCCNYFHYFPQKDKAISKYFQLPSGVYPSDRFLNVLIKDFRTHYYLWNKLWRKSLFSENGVKLPDMHFEDIITTLQLIYHANKVAVKNEAHYYYTQRKSSIVGSVDRAKFNDYIRSLAYIRNFLEKQSIYNTYKLSFTLYGYRVLLTNLKLVFFIEKKEKNLKSFFKDLKRANKLVRYCIGKKFECFGDIKDFPDVFS